MPSELEITVKWPKEEVSELLAKLNEVNDLILKVKEFPLPIQPPTESEVEEAIQAAAMAIWFDDSSDYLSALWAVVRALDPSIINELVADKFSAATERRFHIGGK